MPALWQLGRTWHGRSEALIWKTGRIAWASLYQTSGLGLYYSPELLQTSFCSSAGLGMHLA